MIQTTTIIPFEYQPMPWGPEVERVCSSWAGTPYKEGAFSRGVAVDCVHFMGCVFDELFKTSRVDQIKSLRGDVSLHDREGVLRAMRAVLTVYPNERVRGLFLQPGDIVVTGPKNGGPGHVMISGLRGHLWHATSAAGVSRTGYGLPSGHIYYSTFRPSGREVWS